MESYYVNGSKIKMTKGYDWKKTLPSYNVVVKPGVMLHGFLVLLTEDMVQLCEYFDYSLS